ncbi:hypothetical protein [Streptomyces sp. NPDC037389]|uniref:hypothetical protein n=1 Tax=Streptomyces sp. NPDC037389 TaxID=3155369 RepID=UPI0033E7634E
MHDPDVTPTVPADSPRAGRLRSWCRRRQLRAALRGLPEPGRLQAAGAPVVLAAFTTGGLQEFLKADALQVGILIAGLVIIFGARRKDWAGSMTVGGIALVGLAIIGLSSKGTAVGEFLSGWIWK